MTERSPIFLRETAGIEGRATLRATETCFVPRLANSFHLYFYFYSIQMSCVSYNVKDHLRVLLTCSAKYTFLLQRGHCGVPPPHWRTGLPVGVERNSPMSAAPYRVPVVLAANGAILRAPVAPIPLTELARPRVARLPVKAGAGLVGDATRSGVPIPVPVPASGTVRGSPFSERPTCDGVNCGESSLPWSEVLSAPSSCSESALKVPRVGLSTRVGRRSGPGELVESPNVPPVSFRLIVKEGNKGRPEADGGGEGLEGDGGGLTTRRWGDAAARGGEGDRSLGV